MLLDSNIIIYAAKPEHIGLRELIAEKAPAVSAISQKDFKWIADLRLFNPFGDQESQ